VKYKKLEKGRNEQVSLRPTFGRMK
jgi:hypothetical protein